MKRAALAVVLLVAALGCEDEYIPPRVPTKVVQQPDATPAERRDAACKAKELPVPAPVALGDGPTDLPQGAVVRVEIEGAQDEARARSVIGIAAGDTLTLGKTQEAVRRLYALGGVDDVRLEARPSGAGVVLHFVLERRPVFGEVVIHGGSVMDAPELENAFQAKSGAAYDPAAIIQARATLVGSLRQKGYSDALLNVAGVRAPDGKVDLCVDLHEGSKITIESIAFRGLAKVKEEELKSLIDTDNGRANLAGGVVDPAKLEDAVMKMTEALDTHGLAKATIQTKSVRNGDKVSITLEVDEGPVILLRRYDVKGDLIAPEGEYRRLLSLKSRDPFSRAKLVADIQKIGALHDKRGRKDLQVQPQTEVDEKNNTVDVVLNVIDPKKLKPPPPPPKK